MAVLSVKCAVLILNTNRKEILPVAVCNRYGNCKKITFEERICSFMHIKCKSEALVCFCTFIFSFSPVYNPAQRLSQWRPVRTCKAFCEGPVESILGKRKYVPVNMLLWFFLSFSLQIAHTVLQKRIYDRNLALVVCNFATYEGTPFFNCGI